MAETQISFSLWFFQLYFIALIVFYWMWRSYLKNKAIFYLLLFIDIVLILPVQKLLPGRPVYHINVLPVAILFIALGYLYRVNIKTKDIFLNITSWKKEILICFAFMIGLSVAYYYPGNVGEIGNYLYIIGAISTIYAIFLSQNIFSSTAFIYLGRNSMIVYGIHPLVIGVFRKFVEKKFFSLWDGFPVYFIMTIGILLVCCMVIAIWHWICKIWRKLRCRKE